MIKKCNSWRPVFILTLFYLTLALPACTTERSGNVIGLNENIHHDDFEYAVSDYTVSKEIVNDRDTLIAAGNFYIVTFRVENNAMAVNHAWDNSIAYLVDEENHPYENLVEGQRLMNSLRPFGWKENYLTPARSTETTILVFDSPVSVQHLFLMVRGETLMGDIFNANKFRRMKVQLF